MQSFFQLGIDFQCCDFYASQLLVVCVIVFAFIAQDFYFFAIDENWFAPILFDCTNFRATNRSIVHL